MSDHEDAIPQPDDASPAPSATTRKASRPGDVGLILGTDRLTLFETVTHRKKEMRLVRLAVARIGLAKSGPALGLDSQGSSATGDVEGIDFFRAAREIVAKSGVQPRRVVAALPEGSVTQQVLSVPRMGRKALRQVLANKVRATAGKDPDSILWNWVSLGTVVEDDAEREDILLVSIPRAILLQYYSVLRRAGIQVESFTTPQFATLSIVLGAGASKTGDAAVLSVGSKGASLTILREGRIQFSREVPLPFTSDPGAAAERIVQEVHRSLLFFQQKFPDRSVERLRIVQDDATRARTLAVLASEKLELDVEVVDPLGLVTGDDEILSRARAEVSGLTTLAGLALYRHLRKDSRLGLMPKEVKEKKINVTVDAITVATIAFAGVIASFADQGFERSIELKRHIVTTRDEEITSLSGYDAQAAAIEARLRRLDAREKERARVLTRTIDWSALSLAVSRAVPDSVRLRSMDLAADPNANAAQAPFHLHIAGETLKEASAAGTDLLRLKDSLSRTPDVRDVEVKLLTGARPGDAPARDLDVLRWSTFEAEAAVRVPAEPASPPAPRPPEGRR